MGYNSFRASMTIQEIIDKKSKKARSKSDWIEYLIQKGWESMKNSANDKEWAFPVFDWLTLSNTVRGAVI